MTSLDAAGVRAPAAQRTTQRLTDLRAAVTRLEQDGRASGRPRHAQAGPGHTDAADRAHAVLDRAEQRRSLSGAHTVVALAGATGSGKSSLFNAVAGADVVRVGVRRPTTSIPVAGVVGEPGEAAALLDWLEIGQRHVLDAEPGAGMVLVDLPDIDSIEADHVRTVDRLAATVDVLVWVLDPQKYADNVVHQRYLRPMATHAEVTVVVLNQVDRLAEDERAGVVAHLRHLLAEDGMAGVPIVTTSATTGEGVGGLREALARIVARRSAAEARLAADARAAAQGLLAEVGSPDPAGVGTRDRQALAAALADAAGVGVVADAVARSHRMQARARTGWPPTRWLGRLRADPLRRLGLTRRMPDPALVRSGLPRPTAVQQARVHDAVRHLGAAAAAGAGEPWRTWIRESAVRSTQDLTDALDQAVVATPLVPARTPRWWRGAGALQALLLAATLAGVVWLAAIALVAYLQLPALPEAHLGAVPWPTVLTLGGIGGGLLVAALGGLVARAAARRRARAVRHRLTDAVARVADDVVVATVQAEVERCVAVNRAAARAAG